MGKSMLRLTLDSVLSLKPKKAYVIVGRQAASVMEEAAPTGVEFIHQKERKGTAHAVLAGWSVLKDHTGHDALVVPGDLPLVRASVLKSLVRFHRKHSNDATVLSAAVENPSGFGRIVRSREGSVRIAEEDNAGPSIRRIKEVNTSVYVFNIRELLRALPKISNDNKRREYYLTDIMAVLSRAGKKVGIYKTPHAEDIVHINTRHDLGRALNVLRDRKTRELAGKGVTILNPSSTWIDFEVEIGRDTVIYPSAVLEGKTVIGRRCRIYPGAHIRDSRIGDDVSVFTSTVMDGATIEDRVTVGPFARLRPKTVLRAGSHIGNFVEMKNTDFGRGSKAGHLSYLGDSEIREEVNIGAGAITCNYDGIKKNKTVIEAGAFIGSGTQLVAPVKVGRGAYVAAGSVITKNVSPDALAVVRGKQIEKKGWALRRREKLKQENNSDE
jgi:bifunctional UDP-N-acetylglucosamine pyrophosphorylase/glucosamine-1-phosphate N-acetyltransferase